MALLAVAQTVGVSWLLLTGWSSSREWATACFVCAAGWIPTFLVPTWIYVVDPTLLDITTAPEQALAIVNLSLFALIAGIELIRRTETTRRPRREIRIDDTNLDNRRVLGWLAVGSLSLAGLFAINDGPVTYLSNLDKTGAMNAGLTYLIWGVLALKFGALAVICARWARGERARRREVALVAVAVVLVGLLGARALIAIALVELAVFYHLARRAIRPSTAVLATLGLAVIVILGGGTVKRFQNFQTAHPGSDVSFIEYARTTAMDELADAYANNYADGVRIIAVGREIVPSQTGFEYGKVLLQTAVHPIPAAIRPEIHSDQVIEGTFTPGSGNSYAMPLQLVSYLQLGAVGVFASFVLVGLILALLDRRLASPKPARLSTWLLLIAVLANIPFLLRTGLPRGFAVAAIDVLGIWVVTRTSELPTKASSRD